MTVSLTGISRAVQPTMPSLSYILQRQSIYYAPQTSCTSFFETCTIPSRKLLDNLYSFPFASWSPDGSFFAVHLQEAWAMYPADCLLENPDCVPTLLDSTISDVRPAWGPDGSVMAFVDSTARNIILLSRDCWDNTLPSACLQQTRVLTDSRLIQQSNWSVDGRFMVSNQIGSSGFLLFDMTCLDNPAGCAASAQEFHITENTGTSWPSLSPDSTSILYSALNGTHEVLFLLDIQTGQTRPITSLAASSGYPAWTADGHFIAYVGYAAQSNHDIKIYLLDVTRHLSQQFLHIPGQNLGFPVWAPAP